MNFWIQNYLYGMDSSKNKINYELFTQTHYKLHTTRIQDIIMNFFKYIYIYIGIYFFQLCYEIIWSTAHNGMYNITIKY